MEPPSSSDANRHQKRQQRKACDACRRRKVRCDIIERSEGICSACVRFGFDCRSTTRWKKPRRSQPGHIPQTDSRQSTSSAATSRRTRRLPVANAAGVTEGGEDNTTEHLHEDHSIPSISQPEDSHISPGYRNHLTATTLPANPQSVQVASRSQGHAASRGREELARSGLARFFRHGIDAAVWGIFEARDNFRIAYVGTLVSNLVHLVQLHRSSRPSQHGIGAETGGMQGPSPTALDPAILEQPRFEGSIGSEHDTTASALHYPYPPIRPLKQWKPGPDTWGGMSKEDISSDVASLPETEVCDALVEAYFEHIHPFHPVISKPEFLESYRSPENPPPLLLLQAVLMAGAHACSHHLVANNRHAVKTVLFRRASMLLHVRHEADRVHLMQAAVLFTRHIGDGDTVTGGPYYWSGIAVRIGCGLGMHRHSPTLPPLENSQYRRCWWSAFICEVLSSLENGRPCSIRAEDIDQLTLTDDDITDTPGLTLPVDDKSYRPDFLRGMVELCFIGLDILALNTPAQLRVVDVHSINTRICQWALRFRVTSDLADQDPWLCQLRLHYNMMLLHLHRNLPDETNGLSVCTAAAQAIVGTSERLMALDCLIQCHFSGVGAATAAGIQLAYDIRSALALRSYLVAIPALENLSRLLKAILALAKYWPNAEAVHSVFHELYQEYEIQVSQGLEGGEVVVSSNQPDWQRLLAGVAPPDLNHPGSGQDWLNISNWAGLM